MQFPRLSSHLGPITLVDHHSKEKSMSLSRRSMAPAAIAFTFTALPGLIVLLAGCSGRPSLLPNSDPALNKTSAAFAADAAKRQPFNTSLPSGGVAKSRAQGGYGMDTVQGVNLSSEDW